MREKNDEEIRILREYNYQTNQLEHTITLEEEHEV